MSWAEIKKTVNSNLDTPLNKLIDFTPSTGEARTALTSLGYTQRSTITSPAGTIYLFFKNESVKLCSWDEAYEICTNWWKEINRWAQSQGYGNICIASRMPTFTDNTAWFSSSVDVWTSTTYSSSTSNHRYFFSGGIKYGAPEDNSHSVFPVVLII